MAKRQEVSETITSSQPETKRHGSSSTQVGDLSLDRTDLRRCLLSASRDHTATTASVVEKSRFRHVPCNCRSHDGRHLAHARRNITASVSSMDDQRLSKSREARDHSSSVDRASTCGQRHPRERLRRHERIGHVEPAEAAAGDLRLVNSPPHTSTSNNDRAEVVILRTSSGAKIKDHRHSHSRSRSRTRSPRSFRRRSSARDHDNDSRYSHTHSLDHEGRASRNRRSPRGDHSSERDRVHQSADRSYPYDRMDARSRSPRPSHGTTRIQHARKRSTNSRSHERSPERPPVQVSPHCGDRSPKRPPGRVASLANEQDRVHQKPTAMSSTADRGVVDDRDDTQALDFSSGKNSLQKQGRKSESVSPRRTSASLLLVS